MSRNAFATAALIAAVSAAPAIAQERVPASLENFKPHEVVEAFTSEAKAIGLTQDQLRRLDSLHVAVRDERHRWTQEPGNKAHANLKMKPMISRNRAYNGAMAILTPAQRPTVVQRFNAPDYAPAIPSLADDVPASLEGLKPHQIVQVFLAERQSLGLTEAQVRDLDRLHIAVRDEPHRYTQHTHGAKGQPHLMMEPMISKRRAYNDAMSYLTADQQAQAGRRFRAAGYKPTPADATKQ
jgi:hypothetical protein